jgi:hypothetical protein
MPRKPRTLSQPLSRQLSLYALSATAAQVGMLALAPSAEAKIIYTPADKDIAPHQSLGLDLNHDGKMDFKLTNFASCGTDQCHYLLYQRPAAGNSAVGYIIDSQLLLASALNRGNRIGPNAAFHTGTADLLDIVYSDGPQSTAVLGAWVNVKQRYLGLKFKIAGKIHYGWARLNVQVTKTAIAATLTGYAYETIPNKPIIAGSTAGADVVMAQPGSLGHLARGAAAIRAGRAQR